MFSFCLKLVRVRVMLFNPTFNNISVISWWSMKETGENHRPVLSTSRLSG